MEDKFLKLDTLRSGPFIFTAKYHLETVQQLFVQAAILSQTVKDIPVLPHLAAGLEEDLIKRSIFGTAAIEGNPLSEEAVSKIIDEKDKERALKKAEIEIKNLKRVYYEIIIPFKGQDNVFLLTEEFIKSINTTLLTGCSDDHVTPGNYRNYEVKVGNTEHGGIYTPPKILEDIKTLMSNFIQWINSKEIIDGGPFVRAALTHHYLGRIHPFGDGNGRTARAVEAVILRTAGIKYVPLMLSNYYYKHLDEYFWAFSLAEKNKDYDMTPFIEFFLKGLVSACEEMKNNMFQLIRKFSLRDYFQWQLKSRMIFQRQFDLLTILLDSNDKFTLKDLYEKDRFAFLYRKVSERTARRDLERLKEANILSYKDNLYSLNYHALDQA